MKNNFCHITIDASIAEVQGSEEYENAIMNLGQINCFVGSNNSGKSRIMRHILMKFDNDETRLTITNTFTNLYNDDLWLIKILLNDQTLHDVYFEEDKYPDMLNVLNGIVTTLLGKGKHNSQKSLFFSYEELKKFPDTFYADKKSKSLINFIYTFCLDNQEYIKTNIESVENAKKTLESEIKIIQNSIGSYIENDFWLPKLYIPTLRGMRKLDNSDKDFYNERTHKDYQIRRTFTGLSTYKKLYEHLLGEANKRKLIKNFEDFLSKKLFDNQEVSLIPMLDKDVVYIKIGEKEHPIYDLGDGVQALIILTFPLFLLKEEPHAIFIEEPELHLHPKWQRFFLKTIKEEFPNHYFFFTTHSNVFLNSKDVSIYHVTQSQEKNKSLIRYVDGHAIEALEDLGYHASDLFNTNYILWVEGISDKIYLKKFIKVFDKTLEEGIDYTIMLYGGCAQLDHFLLEAENSDAKISIPFINKNFGFCVDSDRNVEQGFTLIKKKKLLKEKCKELDKFCWITDVRETENLIPKEIWVKAAIDYAKTRNSREYEMATESDCEIPEGDWNFVDLLKTEVKRPNSSNEKISDKSKTLTKELFNNIEKLFDVVNNTDCPQTSDLKISEEDLNVVKSVLKRNIKTSSGNIITNNKIEMAKLVTKIFPQNKEDLKLTPELYDNIKKLVEKIKSVKPESNL